MFIIENNNITVGDLLKKVNIHFHAFLKDFTQLKLSRSLELNTLLLNGTISSLYFPAYRTFMRDLNQEAWSQQNLIEQEMYQERIYGLLIFISLKYRQKYEISSSKTDRAINYFKEQTGMVKDFFILNSAPEDMKVEDYDKFIHEVNTYYKIRKVYIPDLFFDPSFKLVSESNAIKQLFMTSSFEDVKKKLVEKNYFPEPEIVASVTRAEMNPSSNSYNVDPSLEIAFLASLYPKILGILYFGSYKLIDDLIELFNDYFVERIPSKEDEIYQMLLCFGILIKLLKGKGSSIKRKALLWSLYAEVDSDLAEKFIEDYFMINQNNEFVDITDSFDFKGLIQEYNEFLKYAGYVHYGIIYTGVFLVWRSLIKYLEGLQREDGFREKKGGLLENWAYKIAEKYNFAPEKIILRNTKKLPNDSYYGMKKQIVNFPKTPLKFKFNFPDEHHWGPFMEIDLAFKVEDVLFVVECKSTSVPWSVEMDLFKWFRNMRSNIELTEKKSVVLQDCIEKKLIEHPLFQDVSRFAPLLLHTEGINSYLAVFSPDNYVYYIKRMREAINSGDIKKFLKDQMIDYNDKEDVKKKLKIIRDHG